MKIFIKSTQVQKRCSDNTTLINKYETHSQWLQDCQNVLIVHPLPENHPLSRKDHIYHTYLIICNNKYLWNFTDAHHCTFLCLKLASYKRPIEAFQGTIKHEALTINIYLNNIHINVTVSLKKKRLSIERELTIKTNCSKLPPLSQNTSNISFNT